MEPKEIPSGLIPRLLVEITQQLVILVTALKRCDFFPNKILFWPDSKFYFQFQTRPCTPSPLLKHD